MAASKQRNAKPAFIGAFAFLVLGLFEVTVIGRGFAVSFVMALFLLFYALWAWTSGPDDAE